MVGGSGMTAVLGRLGRAWGWIVAYGVLSVLAGIIAIVWPGATLVVIAVVFALQLLFSAVYQFVFAFSIPQESGWLRALVAVVSDVGIPIICKPCAARRPSASITNAAVDPVPSPTIIPSFTSAAAASAAARFCKSALMGFSKLLSS